MKIVFVESSSRAWGSEQHFIDLAKGCRLGGHTVVAVVRAASDVARLLKEAGVDVRETPFRGGGDPRAMYRTWRVVREIEAEWLVTDHQKHYWPLYLVARLTGTKLAVFRHMAFIRSWLTRVLFPRLSDRFFVVSDFAKQALIEAGAPAERLSRLYNPIDLQRFKPDAEQAARTRAALRLPTDAYLVGFIGRHEQGKGIDVLRQALSLVMAEDSEVHALWVGNGPDLQRTKDVVARDPHANRHIFIDWTERPQDYVVALDTLVAPSQYLETFGRIVVEAQACGVPVIASKVGGMLEAFLPAGSGIAYEGACPERLARLILDLKRDPVNRALMGRVGQGFAKQFETPHVVRHFESALSLPSPALQPARLNSPTSSLFRLLPFASVGTLAIAIMAFELWLPYPSSPRSDPALWFPVIVANQTIMSQPGPSMIPLHAWRMPQTFESLRSQSVQKTAPLETSDKGSISEYGVTQLGTATPPDSDVVGRAPSSVDE